MEKPLDESIPRDMKDLISKVQSWGESMLAILTDLETNAYLAEDKLVKLEHLVRGYRNAKSSSKHQQNRREVPPPVISKEWFELEKESIFKNHLMKNLQLSYHNIGSPQLKLCLLSFTIFPGNSIIKKRSLIYWWIGESLVSQKGDKTAEQVGEEVYHMLIKRGLIEPDDNDRSPLMNICKIHPRTRYMLISLAQEVGFFYFNSKGETSPEVLRKCPFSSSRLHLIGGANSLTDREKAKDEDLSTVFNVNQQYLSLQPPWLLNMKNLAVLQLGRWLHSPNYHIEVEDQRFLDDLGAHHKHLKFLSLRGIYRITSLPNSIVKLVSLLSKLGSDTICWECAAEIRYLHPRRSPRGSPSPSPSTYPILTA